MTASTKPREIQMPINALRRGLFVAGLDRDWSETPFLFQGFLIEAEAQIEDLRKLCAWVAIDPAHSDPAVLRALGIESRPGKSTRTRSAASPSGARSKAKQAASEPVSWLRRKAAPAKKQSRKRD